MNLPSGNRTTVIAKTFLGCSKIMSNLVSTKQKSESHMDSVWSDCNNKFSEVITPINHKKQTEIIFSVYINGGRSKPEKD